MNKPIIQAVDLKKNYMVGKTEIRALSGVNLEIEQGEFVVIFGPSGCGKTTLLSLLAALDKPTSGDVIIENESLPNLKNDKLAQYRRTGIGMVFQQFNLLSNLTAKENVALPLILSGVSRREAEKRAKELLKIVGLQDRINHRPTELSGGQQQRVAIARALSANPSILFVDEPTGNLDEESGSEIMKLLDTIHRWGSTIVLVTHNPDYSDLGNRVLFMKNGKISSEKRTGYGINVDKSSAKSNLTYYIPTKMTGSMRITESLRFAMRNFFSRKLRTFLTTLGVALGVGSIVSLVSLGMGLQQVTTRQLASLNSLVTINVGLSKDSTLKLNDDAATELGKIPSVSLVSPSIVTPAQATFSGTATQVILTGIKPDALSFEGVVSDGKKLSSQQVIVSQATAKNFDSADPKSVVGKQIQIAWTNLSSAANLTLSDLENAKQSTATATIVGVSDDETVSTVYLPLSDLEALTKLTTFSSIKLKANNRDQVAAIRDQAEKLGYSTSSVVDLIQKIDGVFQITEIVLAVIGSISLFVALLGIINIMTISLLERTHEVGILKAIGASDKIVKRIFQYEVLFFGLIGGLSGVFGAWLFGKSIDALIAFLIQKTGVGTPLEIFVTPLAFACEMVTLTVIISLLAGQYPAKLASKLSPVEALRYE